MNARNALIAAIFSAAVLGTGVSAAADPNASAVTRSFPAQLDATKGALYANNTGAIGREERNEAGKYLTMAESLWNAGSVAKAQQFLDFARGELGLTLRTPDETVAERVTE